MHHNRHVNSVQWEQALGYARQACADIFRDGGSPRTALSAFGLSADARDWSAVVDRIALALCSQPPRAWLQRKAA